MTGEKMCSNQTHNSLTSPDLEESFGVEMVVGQEILLPSSAGSR